MFFWIAENRDGMVFFFWSKKIGVLCVFFWSRKFVAEILFSQFFPAIRETDLCSGSKREFFEDSFRVRSSSICLDLRLDFPIILFTIFG